MATCPADFSKPWARCKRKRGHLAPSRAPCTERRRDRPGACCCQNPDQRRTEPHTTGLGLLKAPCSPLTLSYNTDAYSQEQIPKTDSVQICSGEPWLPHGMGPGPGSISPPCDGKRSARRCHVHKVSCPAQLKQRTDVPLGAQVVLGTPPHIPHKHLETSTAESLTEFPTSAEDFDHTQGLNLFK